MSSNKSSPTKSRDALPPQRSHGKLRVAALLAAGAAVISERGFEAATMAEIAARAGAPIGSLYRFFPNKEVLGDALINTFCERIYAGFEELNNQVKSLSIAALAEAFLKMLDNLEGERLAIRALLEARANWSEKRVEFRRTIRAQIAKVLILRSPGLNPKSAQDMSVILLQNMKTVGMFREELQGVVRDRAIAELHEMTRLYLDAKLTSPGRK